MFKRIKAWLEWREINNNTRFYQFLVLIGLENSYSFEIYRAKLEIAKFVSEIMEGISDGNSEQLPE